MPCKAPLERKTRMIALRLSSAIGFVVVRQTLTGCSRGLRGGSLALRGTNGSTGILTGDLHGEARRLAAQGLTQQGINPDRSDCDERDHDEVLGHTLT